MITRHAPSTGTGTLGRAQRLHRAATTRFREARPSHLDIGLINNMPDAALDATERQFRGLLDAAADGLAVRLTLYTLPEVPRTDFGRRQVSRYSNFDTLWNSHQFRLSSPRFAPSSRSAQSSCSTPPWRAIAAPVAK